MKKLTHGDHVHFYMYTKDGSEYLILFGSVTGFQGDKVWIELDGTVNGEKRCCNTDYSSEVRVERSEILPGE